MDYGLLGETLGHSFSPQLHKALGGYEYALLPTPPEEVAGLLARRAFKGLNVTIPYKRTVMPLCDEIDPQATAIGAVNTIVNRAGRLIGYNTDIDGFLYQARRAGVELAGKKVVILGSGGASHTAQAAARMCGAKETIVISRQGETTYADLPQHTDADVLVNTTPVGMYPRCDESPVSLEPFYKLSGVLDVVYNPLRTALYRDAEERGIPVSCGLPMLAAQAARAVELFTGRKTPDAAIEQALKELTSQMENIILVGMPGCGKTTIGQQLAAVLGREWVDLDQEIIRRAGRPIPEIFASQGEEVFREQESAVVREYGSRTGLVIATGGGVVKRRENYAPLHQNGRIIHLIRPVEQLAVKGRPLSQATPPAELWRQRAPLYRAFADFTADNSGTVEDTTACILAELRLL